MNKLPSLTGKEVARIWAKFGFEIVRTRGSHHILRHSDGRQTVVPVHAGESIGPGLLAKILRDCDIARTDFENAI
jgi:predicted RNA binding protein YcfA (HicA-like mRNA interferase family)